MTKKTETWKKVESEADAEAFDNGLVAFRTNMRMFGGGPAAGLWSPPPGTDKEAVFFGHVSAIGYPKRLQLSALLQPSAGHSIRELTTPNLLEGSKDSYLQMRPATTAEIDAMRLAVEKRQAVIEYEDRQFAQALIPGVARRPAAKPRPLTP